MIPSLERLNPVGNNPLTRDQVNAFGRQQANACAEKFWPTTATPRSLVLMLTVDVPPLMKIERDNFKILPPLSLMRSTKRKEPFSCGVPPRLSVPASNDTPAGSAPSMIVALV